MIGNLVRGLGSIDALVPEGPLPHEVRIVRRPLPELARSWAVRERNALSTMPLTLTRETRNWMALTPEILQGHAREGGRAAWDAVHFPHHHTVRHALGIVEGRNCMKRNCLNWNRH